MTSCATQFPESGLHEFHRRAAARGLGDILKVRPVVLDVLPGGEMPVTSVILAGDLGEHANWHRREQSVRNRDAQHRRVLLDIEPVLKAQRPELVLGQLRREEMRV